MHIDEGLQKRNRTNIQELVNSGQIRPHDTRGTKGADNHSCLAGLGAPGGGFSPYAFASVGARTIRGVENRPVGE